ncbi:hypothetical protein [Falsiroseomonas selenitidurans]|uniref:4-oxalocrotonate decarboxylase n=1 Tax=Falsiroseomonas selenitidurans TaxID=2716335 RepID=A0ABX1E3Y1_9PROT|nr:hypothetical protein [Falsiroseomonas selenitidurans]NKC31889.1 hypothetical protein [Falsiroseomonas selenitidurans]
MSEPETVDRPAQAARWLAEALESGNPLAPLPSTMTPRDMAEGEETALAVLEELGLIPCGLRLLFRGETRPPLVGPMLEARLLNPGLPVALDALRHPRATAAVVGVLGAPLLPNSDVAPVLAALHAAIDVSATRFADDPSDDAVVSADLARLGLVVVGRAKALAPGLVRAALGPKGARRPSLSCNLAARFGEAAQAARRLGGLPQGAVLVLAGLTAEVAAEGTLAASLGPLGRVEARCA